MIAVPRLATAPPPVWLADRIAAAARSALDAELATWPKPGLVSHVDQGSHDDMDAATFEASAAAITPFFGRLSEAGADGADMAALRLIGLEAEIAMLSATGGVNTHRGAIFGLGLLCAAAGANWSGSSKDRLPAILCDLVRRRWGHAILGGPIPMRSHGTDALRRFGAGGARAQAASGFPHVLEIGLPTLRKSRALIPADEQAARVQTFFALLAETEDTNLLHRGGADGLRFAQREAAAFLRDGGVLRAGWRVRAARVHRAFVVRRLSPGGCADLLAMCLFLDALEIPG